MISKHQNIAEYILSLWQIEDYLRAFPTEAVGSKELKEISEMMHTEGVTETGHISLAQIALQELEQLHTNLMETDAVYRASIYSVLPSLALLKSKSDNPTQSDISMMFVFLYSIMLLRLQKKPISDDTAAMQQQVSRILAYLSDAYKTTVMEG